MNKMNLPESTTISDVISAMFAASTYARASGRENLAHARVQSAIDLQGANDPREQPRDTVTVDLDLTEVGAECDCDGRDANEIAVYLKADELIALDRLLALITFGDLTDQIDILHLYRAMKEIESTRDRRTED